VPISTPIIVTASHRIVGTPASLLLKARDASSHLGVHMSAQLAGAESTCSNRLMSDLNSSSLTTRFQSGGLLLVHRPKPSRS
jgi:hypothetical protein